MTKTKPITPVDLARDVIAQLDAEKIIAENGTYLESTENPLSYTPICEVLEKPCHVCAIGALFVARLNKDDQFNHLTYNDTRSRIMKNTLSFVFTPAQMGLIESAFEISRQYARDAEVPQEDVTRAVAFGYKFEDDDDSRLRAIMSNIIENNGVFKP